MLRNFHVLHHPLVAVEIYMYRSKAFVLLYLKCFVDQFCFLGVSCVWRKFEKLNIFKLPFAVGMTDVSSVVVCSISI